MPKRKANTPQQAEVTEDTQRVETEETAVSGRISLRVTRKELDDCIHEQKHQLELIIRNRNAPPIDGGIGKICAALEYLDRIDPIGDAP